MRIYRVIAAVNIAPGHYAGYAAGDPLALVTARAAAAGPIVFAINAEDAQEVLDEMWVLGNRLRDDVQGRCWPPDVRSLSTGDVLVVYPPGYPQVREPAQAFAVAPTGFAAIPPPRPSAWVRLEGSSATSRPAPPATRVQPSTGAATSSREPL